MPAAIVIPARMGSTRFPGKVLAPLNGKPLIQHVYDRARLCSRADEVLIATDSPEVMAAVRAFGGRAVMTRPDHPSGTDRIAEAASMLTHDIIINVQGDEPLIEPEVIDLAIMLLDDQRAAMSTVCTPIKEARLVLDPNAVKVVMDPEGFALYFSRSPIPYHRDKWPAITGASIEGAALFRHIGIYGYRRQTLLRLAALPPTPLELSEKLEQLRALEHGIRIKVGITSYESLGVDTPADLERVKQCLSTSL